MADEPSDEQLVLVMRHGSGPLERAMATIQLAKRQDREEELRAIVEDVLDNEG